MKTLVGVLILLSFLVSGCAGVADGGVDEPDSRKTSATTTPATTGSASNLETTADTPENSSKPSEASKLPVVTISTSSGKEVRVRVEIADSVVERAQGLMYRKALAERRGMLFVYTEEDELSFYMKNTLIPLSIAFIDSEGRIVDIQDMKPLDEASHLSKAPAQYALEVNQGFFEERDVGVGARVELPE